MNGAQIHLLVNHFPVIVPLVGIAIFVAGRLLHSATTEKVGLTVLLLAGLFALPAYFSGEPAETRVKNYPGISRAIIDQHEESAEFALAFALAMSGVSLVLLYGHFRKPSLVASKILTTILLLLACFELVVMARTAHLGGQIRHEEIRTEEQVFH